MTSVSFLLPTARAATNPDVLQQCIEGINRQHASLDYEILVYSKESVSGENVVWIEEKGLSGPIKAFNTMATEIAKGDYVACITDDHLIINSVEETINNIESFVGRKYKIGGLSPAESPYCQMPVRGQILGDSVVEEDIPAISLLRFPVVRKDAIKLLGNYIFHPDLYYHAGDIWLGYFLYYQGEPAIEGPTKIQKIVELKNSQYEVNDCNIVHELVKKHIRGYKEYI